MAYWRRHAGAVLGVLTFAAFPAQAQAPASTTPAVPQKTTPPAAAPKDSDGITVTGSKPGVSLSIDGRSYLIDKDLNAATGSVADALRSVPSVTVDLQGNITLRGEGVQIWVDGKPSPLFSGASRADVLLNFPAKDIERVEVITTPSAAFSPEGSGGIINLITKQPDKAIATGAVIAQYGSAGATRFGGNFNRRTGKLTASASAYVSNDTSKGKYDGVRIARPNPPATPLDAYSAAETISKQSSKSVNFNLRYEATPKTTFTSYLNYNAFDFDSPQISHYTAFTGPSPTTIYDTNSVGVYRYANTGAGAGWIRKFTGQEHEISANTYLSRNTQFSRNDSVIVQTLPPIPNAFEQGFNGTIAHQYRLDTSYKRRDTPEAPKITIGASIQRDDNVYERIFARAGSPAALTPDPIFSNRFGFEQMIYAVHGTYERKFGAFVLQPGLRLEEVEMSIDQITSGRSVDSDYFRAYPTLNLSYKLDDARNLRAGYSKRVQRPQPNQLNPFRTQSGLYYFSEGNPNLEPQETSSYEIGYQQRSGQTYYLGTLYYRQATGEVSSVTQDLGGGVSFSRPENLGSSRSGGLELVASGRLSSALKYNVNTDIFWKEIDANNLGFVAGRSAFGIGGNASLTWDAGANDMLQLNAFAQGKRLTAQGYQKANWQLNLGWRHKLNDRIAATLTLRDILATNQYTNVIDTPTLYSSGINKQGTRAAFLQLSFALGGGKQADPGFDFSAPAGN